MRPSKLGELKIYVPELQVLTGKKEAKRANARLDKQPSTSAGVTASDHCSL